MGALESLEAAWRALEIEEAEKLQQELASGRSFLAADMEDDQDYLAELQTQQRLFESPDVRAMREDQETVEALEAFTTVVRESDLTLNAIANGLMLGFVDQE